MLRVASYPDIRIPSTAKDIPRNRDGNGIPLFSRHSFRFASKFELIVIRYDRQREWLISNEKVNRRFQ